MTGAGAAVEKAVLGRVRTQLGRLTGRGRVIGIRSAPVWHGDNTVEVDGRLVRVVPCPSVLAVLDALSGVADETVTVVVTDLPDVELGDAVLARLHRGALLDADRHLLLADLLGTRSLDPRIRASSWLVDALIGLAESGFLPALTGVSLGLHRAVGLVIDARLGLDPERDDLPRLIATFDDMTRRRTWRALPPAERTGLAEHLRERHGPAAPVVAQLAEYREDVLAELLVAHALTAAPADDTRAVAALGGFVQSRFATNRPALDALAAAGAAAVQHVDDAAAARVTQQLRHATAVLDELDGAEVAVHSPVLPRGFSERLARAAATLDDVDLDHAEAHREARTHGHRVERVRAAARLQRWVATGPIHEYATPADGLHAHANQLAWVDRALAQVRAGDPDRRVASVLDTVARRAGRVRQGADQAFAARLAAAPETPAAAAAVETFLPGIVAPLAAHTGVLLVIVDGMSGAVAADLSDELTDPRTGWTEIVRAGDGAREAVLAAFPTETRYSRTSLLTAALRTGDQGTERAAFPYHPFWPPGGALLVHKSGVAGRDGGDVGAELEDALQPGSGPAVVAVVLNAVDDTLAKGRAASDPRWRVSDVTGLPALLERAVAAGRLVVLIGDHGHVLEHGSTGRPAAGGGARWRPDDGHPAGDEVLLRGPRVLVPGSAAILLVDDCVRFGARSGGGYHGGASLAEAAIPLIVLAPPDVDVPEGWVIRPLSAPSWWNGGSAEPPRPPASPRRRPAPAPSGEGLFDLPDLTVGRGARLVDSQAFRAAHAEIPANRVPSAEVFARVVNALAAGGGRQPIAVVTAAAGAAGRNPRGLVSAMGRVLNRDGYPVLTLTDRDRAVVLDLALLDEQFPVDRP